MGSDFAKKFATNGNGPPERAAPSRGEPGSAVPLHRVRDQDHVRLAAGAIQHQPVAAELARVVAADVQPALAIQVAAVARAPPVVTGSGVDESVEREGG